MQPRSLVSAPRGYPPFAVRSSVAAHANPNWFIRPLIAGLIILPILVVLFAPAAHRIGMLVAYANVFIIGVAMIHFIRQRTFEASVPVLFLTWLLFSWPVSSIYFGLFDPDIAYVTQRNTREPFLDGNVRLQAVTMLFLVGYLTTVTLLNRARGGLIPTFSSDNPATARMAYLAVALTTFAFAGGMVSRLVTGNESLAGYFMLGVFLYLYAIPVIIGVLFPKIFWVPKIIAFGFLGFTSLAFILFNLRFFALVPWAMIFFGYLFFGEASNKKKLVILAVVLIGFPVMLVLGDTVRNLTKGKNRELSLEERRAVLSNWTEWLGQGSVFSRTFARIFSPSGHAIVTRTPEEVPYLDFDAARFIEEYLAVVFIPSRFYNNPYYSNTAHLNDYNHLVNEKTSEELSLPGSLWMYGGYLPVILGSMALGLLHTGVMKWIRYANRVSAYKGLFYFALIAGTIMWGFNLDLLTHTRSIVRGMAIAIVLWYCLVKWILGRSARRVPQVRPSRLVVGVGQ